MWPTLAEFSEEHIENLFSGMEYEPMRRLIRKLRKKDYAVEVFSYTSLFSFWLTLQTEYASLDKTDSIGIIYSFEKSSFGIFYQDINLQENSSYNCSEKQILTLIDAFVLRLFLTRNNKPLPFESEETPTYQIGQNVETTQHSYNKTRRTGIVYKILKHHKQNRFMYFLEENGKKHKKRYFREHLKPVSNENRD